MSRQEPSFVQLESDAGDYIGQGHSYRYTQADALITVRASGGALTVRIEGDEEWGGTFRSPQALTKLTPGTYANLERWPFHDPSVGGIDWSGEGRGCNTLTGSFTVDEVAYAGDSLTAIKLSFEQHCEGGTAKLRGTIEWSADDPTVPPGPVDPVPATLWRPAAGSTPASGNYVHLTSEAGDYVGQGRTFTYTGGPVTVSGNGGQVSVNVGNWHATFQAMESLDRLQTGYYAGVRRWPFHNPVKGGLDWSGEGRGCNTLVGWFAVDRVTYTSGRLTALTLRFEQRCEGSSSALRGKIHWTE